MAEETSGNGTGRLDRIERTLDRMAEEFRRDHQQLLKAQVILQDELERQIARDKLQDERIEKLIEHDHLQDERIKALDARVDALVSAIGELIRKWDELPSR
jgi:hypothetical protein